MNLLSWQANPDLGRDERSVGRQPAATPSSGSCCSASLNRTGELEVLEPAKRLLEPDLQLEPRQLVAEAEVAPDAERKCFGAVARDVEAVRIGILRRVAVGRGYQSTTFSFSEIGTPRISRSQVAVLDWCMIGVCQRRISSTAFGISAGSPQSFSTLGGMLDQRQIPPANALRVVSLPPSHQLGEMRDHLDRR